MKQLLQVARVIQTSVDMRAMRFACRIIASTIRIMRSMSSSAENGFTFFRSRTTFDDRNDATKTKLQPLVPNSASPVDPVCLSPHQQPLSVPVLAAEPDWRCRLSAEWRLQRTCCLHFAAATNKLSTMALRVFSASAILAPIGSVTNSSQSESSKKRNRGSEAVFSRSANVFMSNSSRANHRFRHLTLRLRMMRYVKCQMSGKQRHVLALAICLQY